MLIDEYQHAPELLDAIKAELNRDLHPGRFVLASSTQYQTVPQALIRPYGSVSHRSVGAMIACDLLCWLLRPVWLFAGGVIEGCWGVARLPCGYREASKSLLPVVVLGGAGGEVD